MRSVVDDVEVDGSDTVYADPSAVRYVIPVLVAVVALGAGALALVRTVLTAEPQGAEAGVAAPDGNGTTTTTAPAPLDPRQAAQQRADALADALGAGAIVDEPFAFEQPAEVIADIARVTGGLGPFTLAASAGPVVLDDEVRASGPVTLNWRLDDGTAFSTEGEIRLALIGTTWQVDWAPTVLHSGLTPGDVLVRERVTSTRAPILGADGFELIGERPTVEIGVVTRNVESIDDLSQRLSALLGIDEQEVADLLRRSPSDSITPVAERRAEAIDPLRVELGALPGVVLADTTAPLPPYDGYGRALLGWAGEVTAEILERSPEYFALGDVVGRSGLQAVYNERLSGLPGYRIRIERGFPLRDESGQEVPPDADVNIVHLSAPQPPEPVQTTLDHRAQTAAEQALAGTELPSSLVAVRVSTGEILAVANGPGPAAENHALTGRYPPGSIFKVVTAYAALDAGNMIDQPIGCPATMVVDGREFRNSEGHDLGTVSLRDAFAHSCNTSFIELGMALDAGAFGDAARRMGVGVAYDLGTNAFSGSVPKPGTAVDQAATAFGQGEVLVSPLSMAVMAASVAAGIYRPPRLVVDDTSLATEPRPLDPEIADQVRQMMTAVVGYGTGQAARGVPGSPVAGKTGTAEFGAGDPPPAHAWFVGFQDDVAFAVVVDGGGFGGSVAAPLASDFLRRLSEQG